MFPAAFKRKARQNHGLREFMSGSVDVTCVTKPHPYGQDDAKAPPSLLHTITTNRQRRLVGKLYKISENKRAYNSRGPSRRSTRVGHIDKRRKQGRIWFAIPVDPARDKAGPRVKGEHLQKAHTSTV